MLATVAVAIMAYLGGLLIALLLGCSITLVEYCITKKISKE